MHLSAAHIGLNVVTATQKLLVVTVTIWCQRSL